jgi:hypothetical protein
VAAGRAARGVLSPSKSGSLKDRIAIPKPARSDLAVCDHTRLQRGGVADLPIRHRDAHVVKPGAFGVERVLGGGGAGVRRDARNGEPNRTLGSAASWMDKAAAIGMSRPDRDRLADPFSTAEGGMGMRQRVRLPVGPVHNGVRKHVGAVIGWDGCPDDGQPTSGTPTPVTVTLGATQAGISAALGAVGP